MLDGLRFELFPVLGTLGEALRPPNLLLATHKQNTEAEIDAVAGIACAELFSFSLASSPGPPSLNSVHNGRLRSFNSFEICRARLASSARPRFR